jgi:hypothetical protein
MNLIPDGYELGRCENHDGLTLDEDIERCRCVHWRPLRRMMLEMGVDGQTYVHDRAKYRRLLARYVAMWLPARIKLVRPATTEAKGA